MFLVIKYIFSLTFLKDNKDFLNDISKAKLCSRREFSLYYVFKIHCFNFLTFKLIYRAYVREMLHNKL